MRTKLNCQSKVLNGKKAIVSTLAMNRFRIVDSDVKGNSGLFFSVKTSEKGSL